MPATSSGLPRGEGRPKPARGGSNVANAIGCGQRRDVQKQARGTVSRRERGRIHWLATVPHDFLSTRHGSWPAESSASSMISYDSKGESSRCADVRLAHNDCGDRLALNIASLMPIGRSKSQISLLHRKNNGSTRFGRSSGKSAGFDRKLVSFVSMSQIRQRLRLVAVMVDVPTYLVNRLPGKSPTGFKGPFQDASPGLCPKPRRFSSRTR